MLDCFKTITITSSMDLESTTPAAMSDTLGHPSSHLLDDIIVCCVVSTS